MKVLQLIASMNPASGGPAQAILNSMPVLEKLNIEREVVSLDAPVESFLKEYNFIVHALGPSKTSWQYSSKLYSWLVGNLARFDIVIVNGLWLYHGYAVNRALKTLQKINRKNKVEKKLPRLLVMPHGMLDPYFQRASHRKLKALRNWMYWKLVEQKVVNQADGVLFTCEAELLLARQPFKPYRPKRELNVGFGISDPPAFSETMKSAFISKCPQIDGKPYLLFLGRIHNKKGVDLLVQAYIDIIQNRAWKKDFSNLPHLVIAGPGVDTSFGLKLREMAAATEASGYLVHFTGMLTGDAKWGAYYGCETFVLPSHQENFGIAIAEAMSCGKAVLISKEVNIWPTIAKRAAGIVREDNLEGTQELLTNWLELSNAEKQMMGQNALRTFQEEFAVEAAAERLLAALSN